MDARLARQLDDRPSATEQTARDRHEAVLRSLIRLRQNVGDEHSLRSLAGSALLSPYYFHRVFRQLTAATPARFVAAVRMAEAKRLLACTSASVTDICMQVGYSSLGTFTWQFTRLVGVSPRRFRRLVRELGDRPFDALLAGLAAGLPAPARPQAEGTIERERGEGEVAVVGLFPDAIPQGCPAACAIVPVPGPATVGDLPDGEYHAMAMSFHPSVTVAAALADEGGYLVGTAPVPVRIRDGRAASGSPFRIGLRPREPIDPPIVIALPLLLAAESGP